MTVSTTRGMIIRQFDGAAAPRISEWARSAEEVRAWCGRTEVPVPAEVVAQWSAPADVVAFVLVERDETVAYGELWVDDAEQEVELAHLIVAPAHRGRGVGRQLVAGLVEHAYGYHPLAVLRVHPDNEAARRCYLAAGLARVGAVEEAAWNEGQPLDYVWMASHRPDPDVPAPRGPALGPPAVTPRPLAAYRDMFELTDHDLVAGPILDCPGGASPFGAQVRALGGEVVSVDPAYGAAPSDLVARARADVDRIAAWQRSNPDGFDWSYLRSPQALGQLWGEAIEGFAADFQPDGRRYVAAALPDLPFPDCHFSLSVSGFLLFVYPELLGFDDHLAALLELARVTRGEVRVYPLHDTVGTPYARLPELRAALDDHGIRTEIRSTGCSYSPLPGSDRMLVCRRVERAEDHPQRVGRGAGGSDPPDATRLAGPGALTSTDPPPPARGTARRAG